MGLDILLLKVVEHPKANPDDYILLSPELEMFSDLAFDKEVTQYNFEKVRARRKLKLEDLTWQGVRAGKRLEFTFTDKLGKKIKFINPPTSTTVQKCLAYKEISRQRKGACEQFYKDGIWDTIVTDLRTLKKHHKKYFSKSTLKVGETYGYSVEYNLSAKENSIRFKRNILDKFVEGKMFVMYC